MEAFLTKMVDLGNAGWREEGSAPTRLHKAKKGRNCSPKEYDKSGIRLAVGELLLSGVPVQAECEQTNPGWLNTLTNLMATVCEFSRFVPTCGSSSAHPATRYTTDPRR